MKIKEARITIKDLANSGQCPCPTCSSQDNKVTVLANGWPLRPLKESMAGCEVLRAPASPFGYDSNIKLLASFGLDRLLNEKPEVINSQDYDGAWCFEELARRRSTLP